MSASWNAELEEEGVQTVVSREGGERGVKIMKRAEKEREVEIQYWEGEDEGR